MNTQNLCPCCGRHCDLSAPRCERGEEFKRTGVVPSEPHHHKERHTGDNRFRKYHEADVPKKLIINLRDINHVMRNLYEGKGSQKRILIVLNEAGKITQSELTEYLGIQPGSASEVIAKLEEAGSIVRSPSETDRRTMDIALTEQGRELAETFMAQREKRHEEMFSCLSEEERSSLLTLLEKINRDWKDRYQEQETESEFRHGSGRHGRHGHHDRNEHEDHDDHHDHHDHHGHHEHDDRHDRHGHRDRQGD